MIADLRYAVRTLHQSPSFTLVALVTLALGIGANTTIFSAVDAVLLHPLLFPHPEQLVEITKDMPMFGLSKSTASSLDFIDYRESSHSFSGMAAIARETFNLAGEREPLRVPGMRVSANLFPLLGVSPLLGRGFTTDEEQFGRHRVAIIAEPLWRSRFGSNPGVIGTQVQLEGEKYVVVGVARPMLDFLSSAQLWIPFAFSQDDLKPNARGHQFLDVVARLKPGVTLTQANADLRAAGDGMTQRLPDWYPKGWSINAEPLSNAVSGPIRAPLLSLVGAVALVLMIGCANVANLVLARGSARQKEICIRTALGAGRARIVRQLLLESCMLAIVAGLAGLLLAVWAMDAFSRFGPEGLLRGQHLQVSPYVAGFTAIVSLATTMLFGLIPALAAARVDLNDALKETIRTAGTTLQKRRFREWLIGAEVALSLVLLIAAGLLIRSFIQMQRSSPGFAADRVLTAQLSLSVVDYRTPERVSRSYGQLLDRIGSIPGVVRASAVNNLPLSGSNRGGSFDIIGHPWGPNGNVPDVDQRSVLPGYFDALGIPIFQGRVFSQNDGWSGPMVAVVDEPFARQFFEGRPIGKQISGPSPDGSGHGDYTIVGVVGGIKHHSLSLAPVPTIYYPQLQAPIPAMAIVVRTAGSNPLSLLPALRREVARLDPTLPLYRVATMEQVMANSLERARFSTTLLGAFALLALLALLLAALGIYGAVSYSVGQRTREIGIRMALGARSTDALHLVLGQCMVPVLCGMSVGLAVSPIVTRILATELYGVNSSDPLTLIPVSCFLVVAAAAAGYFPARRAARVDPMVALRYE